MYFVYFNVFKILLGMDALNDTDFGLCISFSNPLSNLLFHFGFSLLLLKTQVFTCTWQ